MPPKKTHHTAAAAHASAVAATAWRARQEEAEPIIIDSDSEPEIEPVAEGARICQPQHNQEMGAQDEVVDGSIQGRTTYTSCPAEGQAIKYHSHRRVFDAVAHAVDM